MIVFYFLQVLPKGFSIMHLGKDRLGLPSAICITLYRFDLVSTMLYAPIFKG
jgi:hypothetical protein